MSEGGYGAPKPIVTSIYEISPETLEAVAAWIEQRGIRTPISNLVGGNVALTLIKSGTGSPNGAVYGSVGALYLRLDGGAGTTLYVKESGTNTNTGWVGK